MVDVETIEFEASDGWKLVGDVYRGPSPKRAILISAGTGFPRRFYKRAANYLAEQGAIVLTYDYREIGDSTSGDISKSQVQYTDWGRYDLNAAVEELDKVSDGLPIMHVAHSVGGHFIGVATNHTKIKKHANIAVGVGYWGAHKMLYWPLEMFFWWIMGTFSLARWNYIKSIGGWRGAPLPKNVFTTWRRWSSKSSYFKDELNDFMQPQHYDEVIAPFKSWVFTDDPIATVKATKSLMEVYPNASSEISICHPQDIGVNTIGHDGAFRVGRDALWQQWWDWFVLEE
ncbi:alpha/beta hydrolase family protein [Hirschia maritima]|uniref:alpha/beta hydrolase family protein n=1 Tax=Hirschia maritima TaxID=1121961 RepID=UPI00035EA7D5|nr:alpha/beta hydrolase [Hirschia maritima]